MAFLCINANLKVNDYKQIRLTVLPSFSTQTTMHTNQRIRL